MKSILPLSLLIIAGILCVAAESPRKDAPPGDWRNLVATNSEWAEKLKQGKVSTEDEARRKTSELLTDARSIVTISALFRLARADTELGSAGDFVWEARVLWGRDVADVIWVSASTGEARRIFPR